MPQACIPSPEVRDVRELLRRHRAFFVSMQTKVKNRIHSYLIKLGVRCSKTDVFGKAGMKSRRKEEKILYRARKAE